GQPPALVAHFGGTFLYPTTAGTGAAWDQGFPCGPGQLAYTVCPSGKPRPFIDGTYAKVGVVFDRSVPLRPTTDVAYTFEIGAVAGGGGGPGGAWSITGSPGARAVIRNNVVFVLVPADTVGNGAYRVRTAAGNRHDVQPPVSDPPLPIPSAQATTG